MEKRAFTIARIATSNSDDALDIVQDAMTRLVKKYADKSPDDWPPLFHRILQSVIRDWYRKQKTRNRWLQFWGHDEEQGDLMDAVADTQTAEPDQQLGTELALEDIQQVIQQLPLRQQQAFVLRCLEGLDTAATAQAMQISQGSVKTHYFRAVRVLRQQLEAH